MAGLFGRPFRNLFSLSSLAIEAPDIVSPFWNGDQFSAQGQSNQLRR